MIQKGVRMSVYLFILFNSYFFLRVCPFDSKAFQADGFFFCVFLDTKGLQRKKLFREEQT